MTAEARRGQEAAGASADRTGHRAAVIGSPVAHSLSPVLHRAAYADLGLSTWSYTARLLAPDQLADLLAQVAAPVRGGPVWEGLSVTMPHKQAVTGLLDAVDPLARAVGAVNTVVAQRHGGGRALLTGVNTDVAGIVGALREVLAHQGTAPGPRAVVLGSGATASSALAALTELGATSVLVAARRHAGPGRAAAAAHRMGLGIRTLTWSPGDPASDAAVAHELAAADLVVSTLPAHAADTLGAPLARALGGRPRPGALLDVVYAPWPTALAATWEAGGGVVAPGWLMLLHQAAPQVQLMTGRTPRLGPMRAALLHALGEGRGAEVSAGAAGPDAQAVAGPPGVG